MLNRFACSALTLSLALVTFWGTLVDKTTNQPLNGVRVIAAGPSNSRTTSDYRGKFTLTNLRPGDYTITVQSKDVPQQHFQFKITRGTTQTLKACSTTLDYQCGTAGGSAS